MICIIIIKQIIMKTNFYPLLKENANDLIGKKIEFVAEGYNKPYKGVAIIKSVDLSQDKPLLCECIAGDDLRFAFLDDHGIETSDGGETFQLTKSVTSFSYSDSYREILVRDL